MEVEEECDEEADEGELVVLRRTLSGQKAPNHEEQRENIFIRGVLSMAMCAPLLLMEGVMPMWLPPP